MKQLSEWIDEIAKEAMQAQEKMLVNDIIDIYKGDYKDYGTYLKEKELIIKYCKEQAQKKEMSVCFEPLLLAEPIFNYIKIKGENE